MESPLEKLQKTTTMDVMSVIYDKINELFGAGNQLFTMEFPARGLNNRTYEYDDNGCYSVLTKPYPVQEAEFTLSNQLFDISPIVQGPNGEKLSTVFNTLLNNYVPKLDTLKPFVSDQRELRNWLLEEIDYDDENGNKQRASRMHIAKELYGKFLEGRNKWYEEKTAKYDDAKSSPKREESLDSFSKWLSSEGLVKEETINNLFNDAVVRGHYHEVLTLLGFLNVSSPAEVLEETKQKMRSSLRRSLDGSSDIYPVQFQPSNWAKSLRPNVSPKDLTMTTESLMADFRAKNKRLNSLKAQLAEIGITEIPVNKQDELKKAADAAAQKVSDIESELITQYGKGAVEAVNTAIKIFKAVDPTANASDAITTLTSANGKPTLQSSKTKVLNIIGDSIGSISENMVATFETQQKALTAQKVANDALMEYSEAKVKDKRLLRQRVQEQIDQLEADLKFLAPLVSGVIAEEAKNENDDTDPDIKDLIGKSKEKLDEEKAKLTKEINDTPDENKSKPEYGKIQKRLAKIESLLNPPLMIDSSSSDSSDSDFMDVIIKAEMTEKTDKNESTSSVENSSFKLGGWFFSVGGSHSSQKASEIEKHSALSSKLEIGFRAKKVTFERGGWFNPTIFKLSHNYFRLADMRCSGGNIDKSTVHKADCNTFKNSLQYTDDHDANLKYLLPAFPTGFVIVKDITIRVESNAEESASNKEYMKENSENSGGIFGFRASNSKASNSQSESAYFGSSGNFFYIRIPGPQIMGWFLEFTSKDNAQTYKAIETDIFKTLNQMPTDSKAVVENSETQTAVSE
ncbi:hypothetical protein [Viscerimonas tarda]